MKFAKRGRRALLLTLTALMLGGVTSAIPITAHADDHGKKKGGDNPPIIGPPVIVPDKPSKKK
jgi:hypothetical protein